MIKKPSSVWVSQNMIKEKIDANYMHYKFINLLDCKLEGTKKDFQSMENGLLIDTLTDYTANGSFESLDNNVKYTDSKGIPFIRIKNMSEDGLVLDDLYYIDNDSYRFLKKSKLEGNELLFSKTGAKLGLAMVFPSNFGKASLADNIFKVVYKSEYDVHYIASFLNSKYGKLWVERLSQGSAQPTIIKESFRQIKIPIPSPEIQKYIGDKVRRAEELREEAKRLENEINTFFNEKFSDIYNSIDESKVYHSKFTWKSAENIRDVFNAEYFTLIGDKYEQVIREQKGVYLDDLLKDCFMGKSPSQYADKGPKILKVKNLTNGGLDWSDSDHVDKEFYVKNKRCHLQHGDVFIIPAAHLAKYIGEKVDVYIQGIEGIKYPDAMASGKIIVIRPNFDKVNPIYLCLVMREKFVYHQIQRQVSGITASYYPKDVRQLCIPLIEREKQDMVADKYIEIIKCKEQAKQLIQEAKQDVEDLIEGNFDMSKLDNNYTAESRC